MLNLILDHKIYALPLNIGAVTGVYTLDENWRTMDYKNGDGLLALSLSLTYEVPLEVTDALFHQGVVPLSLDDLEEGQRNRLQLDFDIGHSSYNPKTAKLDMHNGFPHFPLPAVLENHRFGAATLEQTTCWFPEFGVPARFSQLGFGQLSEGSHIGFCAKGKVKDAVAELGFSIGEEALPLAYNFQIEGYANEFVGLSEGDMIKEIQDCFASIYGAVAVHSQMDGTDAPNGGVRIRYRF
ncbi:Hypothetical protein I595_949 [Croceitalea dokdonensis DOKDO 023]|uniref:Uncharacterized protein n=1 Tax=Croceitalea dokdonensis DOKDO 023 TaxID=1300341 RepID=A0A0P7AWQ0_9FLAO|nr:hypothetical protein [Croceitalea dokdonensis]KPM32531.1 Hypothetical protein I595_949 [Croceitalea dokdonensis DOKDO 023]